MAAGFKMYRESSPKSFRKNRTLRELMSELPVDLRLEMTKPRFPVCPRELDGERTKNAHRAHASC